MNLKFPDEENNPLLKLNIEEMLFFKSFLQGILDRRIVGGMRYGPIKKKQKYLTRLSKELKSYREEGNMEQLLNIAVYCYLEAYAPENKKFHWDPTVDSVTRGKV
jgi:hypothetical protein